LKKIIINILLFLIFSAVSVNAQLNNRIKNSTQDSVFVMSKSPWGAVLRSAILPGWGQFYNESYWKIPVIWGGIGALAYGWVDRNKLTVKYRDLYNKSLLESENGKSEYKQLREFYKDQRDLFAVFMGLAYFLNLVDAYVDAHLFDFDVSKNKTTNQTEFRIRLRF